MSSRWQTNHCSNQAPGRGCTDPCWDGSGESEYCAADKRWIFLKISDSRDSGKEKGAVGVRGIKLQKTDELEQIHLFEEGTDTKVKYGEKK